MTSHAYREVPHVLYIVLKHHEGYERRVPGLQSAAQVEYPEIDEDIKPRHRFMSAYEQKKEAWDKAYQYLLFAADPYEVIAFKIPNIDVDRSENFFTHW